MALSICICYIAIWQYLYLLHCYMAVFVFATLLYGSICICRIAIWQYLYLPHCYMAVFGVCGVQVKKIQKALRFRKKSSVEQYLTVYTEKSTSEITKKFPQSE